MWKRASDRGRKIMERERDILGVGERVRDLGR